MSNSEVVTKEVSKAIHRLGTEVVAALAKEKKAFHEDYPEVVRRDKKLVDGLDGSMQRLQKREIEILGIVEGKYVLVIRAAMKKNAG